MYSRGMRTNFTIFLADLREGFGDLGLRGRAGVGDVEGVADGGGFIHYFETNLDLDVDELREAAAVAGRIMLRLARRRSQKKASR